MKTMLHLLFRLGLVVLLAVLPAACKHKELCEDHSHMVTMRVRFDWSAAPEATPRTMVLHLFAPDGSHYNRYEFSSPEGGLIRVHTGSYGLQFHNGDMEHFVERGSRYGISSSVSASSCCSRCCPQPASTRSCAKITATW